MSEYGSNSVYLGEPPAQESRDKDVEARAKALVMWCMSESQRHYEALRRSWDDFYDRRTNQPLKLRQTNRIRSNVPSGRAAEQIDTLIADMKDKIHKKKPLVAIEPREPGDESSAPLIEALLDFDFDQMEFWKIDDEVLDSAATYGSGLAKMAWVNRTIKRPLEGVNGKNGRPELVDMPGYRGPVIMPLFIYDVFPHPQKQTPDDDFPICHVSWQCWSDLKELSGENLPYWEDAVEKIPDLQSYKRFPDFQHVGFLCDDDMFARVEQRQRLGWTNDSRLEPDGVMVIECEAMFRMKLNEAPIRVIITIANGEVIRISPSPLRDESSIYLNAKIINIPGQFYGMSMIQKNKPMLHVEEVVLNMGLQQLAQSVNRMKIIDPSKVMNAQSFDDSPGGIIFARPTSDLRNVAQTLDSTPVSQDVFRFIDYTSGRGRSISGVTSPKTGEIQGGEVTATEFQGAGAQATIRFKHYIGWYSATFLVPAAQKMHLYNRDYLDAPYVLRIMGEQGAKWETISDKDLSANVDYVAMGPLRDENEALRSAQLQNLFKITTALQAFGWSQPVLQEIFVQIADSMGFRDMDKLKQLMGYGAQPETLGMIPPPQAAGMPEAPRMGPNKRADRRVGSPTSMGSLAKSLGASLGGAVRTK